MSVGGAEPSEEPRILISKLKTPEKQRGHKETKAKLKKAYKAKNRAKS